MAFLRFQNECFSIHSDPIVNSFLYDFFFQKLAPEKLDNFPKLVAFMRRFEELPKIADYVKTDK